MDVGATLRQARERRGLTLDRLARITRVSPSILTAIERNDRGAIPPRPFGRGFVRTYASEVGLNPEQIVHEYFSQFAPAPERKPETAAPRLPDLDEQTSPRPLVVLLTCAVAAAILIAVVVQSFQQEPGIEVVGTSGGRESTPAAATGRLSAASAPVAPRAAGVTIAIEATAPSWVRADVDGRRAIYRMLQPGEREVLRGDREIRIRTGDAGALRWQVNGGAIAPMGKAGEVRTAHVTADAAQR